MSQTVLNFKTGAVLRWGKGGFPSNPSLAPKCYGCSSRMYTGGGLQGRSGSF